MCLVSICFFKHNQASFPFPVISLASYSVFFFFSSGLAFRFLKMNMDTLQGAFPDGEWDFSRIFSPEDQLDFTSDQFLGQFSFPGENDGVLHHFTNHLAFCPNPETNLNNMGGANESLLFSWNNDLNPDNLNHVSQENSISSNCSSSVLIPSSNHETYFFSDSSSHYPAANDITMSMDFCIVDENNSNSFVPVFPKISMTEAACVSENMSNFDNNAVPDKELQLKRKFDIPKSEANPSSDTIKKKTRVARNVPKSKKNAKAKKNQKLTPNSKDKEEEERNGGQEGQSFSSCSSEEDNGSQDSNGGAASDSKMSSEALNSTGKVRASRGSATDPQSLYARKRRERINERLRILQNLVPNGTKVDISTMLEEAVQYVKFLQLQIKLLSSDDLWMYAPIAYNGMDIGLNHKISKLL